MVTVNNSDYYNNIPAGRDLNNLPNNSNTGTTVGLKCYTNVVTVVANKI